MDWLQTIALAVLQGLTEFLPISSSAHLILLPRLVGWEDQGLAFDVAVHVGSLAAVVTYFRHSLVDLWRAWWRSWSTGARDPEARLAWAVVVGTLPVLAVGWWLNGWAEEELRSPTVIAKATLVFGLLLWVADRYGRRRRDEHSLTWPHAAVIGLAQALALIPGTSRSGITIAAGLMLGLSRSAASRFSFLLSVPVILAAGSVKVSELLQSTGAVPWLEIVVGAAVSGVTAYLCIHYFLKLIERIGVVPFVVYRIVLAAVLFYVFAN